MRLVFVVPAAGRNPGAPGAVAGADRARCARSGAGARLDASLRWHDEVGRCAWYSSFRRRPEPRGAGCCCRRRSDAATPAPALARRLDASLRWHDEVGHCAWYSSFRRRPEPRGAGRCCRRRRALVCPLRRWRAAWMPACAGMTRWGIALGIRRSGGGRNPGAPGAVAGADRALVCPLRRWRAAWMPACAGMTRWGVALGIRRSGGGHHPSAPTFGGTRPPPRIGGLGGRGCRARAAVGVGSNMPTCYTAATPSLPERRQPAVSLPQ